jgi:localization factor PodJL
MPTQAPKEISGARADAPASPYDQSSKLDVMRERLSTLSDEARSIRSQVPSEFRPDVERIQQQMQRLGERLSELSGGAIPSPTGRGAPRPLDDARRADPEEVILLGAPRRADDPWDEESARALTRFYESGAAYYGREADNDAGAEHSSVAAARVLSLQTAAVHAASEQRSWQDAQPAWLDERFAEIAHRIEQALAEIRPESSLLRLGDRFDKLEARMSAVLSNVATHADLKELRVAEAQIEDIGQQLGQLRRQLERLDAIDAHLGTLTEHLSDDHFLRMLNQGHSADAERLEAIDSQLASIGQQLARDRQVESAAGREAMEAHSRDIGEVRGLLENLIHERRHHDENNASMLETMQQAIIRVLDRMDALELGQHGEVSPATQQSFAEAAAPIAQEPYPLDNPYPPMEDPLRTMEADLASLDERAAPQPPHQAAPPERDAEYQMPRNAPFAQRSEDPPAAAQSDFTIAPFDLEAAFARPPAVEALASERDDDTAGKSIDPLRHDFIADAHRAKLKAAARVEKPSAADRARTSEIGASLDKSADQIKAGSIKPRERRSFLNIRSPRVLMGILMILAMIPAAVFFMPRVPNTAKAPATTNSLPSRQGSNDGYGATKGGAAVPALPHENIAPGEALPRKQSQRLENVPSAAPGTTYQDASFPGPAADYERINTGSIPGKDSLNRGAETNVRQTAAEAGANAPAARDATPAELMEQQVLRANGAVGGSTPIGLPPATVGPFSLRMAAAQGDASAQFEVASRLADEKNENKDMKEALEWYQRSASSGFAIAQFRLGAIYERGLGVKRDLARAEVWYTRAAEQGNVKAMHNLAVLIASQSGADYTKAAKWFGEAAARGLPDSQFNLAVLYENGLGVKKDLTEAYKWLLLAARSGDSESKTHRDAVKKQLSAADRVSAEGMAEKWRITPSNPVANDFRAAGQAWQLGTSARG